MNNYTYPLTLKFKITTFSNDFVIKDANDNMLAYVRQKMFKLKEEIQIYNNDSKQQLLYTIKANKWLDFSAAYTFTNEHGIAIGQVLRKGWASIWKARYDILDAQNNKDLFIEENNAWIKVIDSFFGQIPVINLFTGYLFNPKYNVKRVDGTLIAQLIKKPSFFGRKFELNKHNDFKKDEEQRIILSLMMMVLLERRRG